MDKLALKTQKTNTIVKFDAKNLLELLNGSLAEIRTNNCIERLNLEIRHRTSVVGAFPDATSAIMLVTVQLNYIVVEKWGKRYMIV